VRDNALVPDAAQYNKSFVAVGATVRRDKRCSGGQMWMLSDNCCHTAAAGNFAEK
jgi:hypothetical protein